MSLREDLAKRFRVVLVSAVEEFNARAAQSLEGNLWDNSTYAAADECIRQMEYAWRTGFDSCCNRGMLPSPPPDPIRGDHSVHIAPPEWKP